MYEDINIVSITENSVLLKFVLTSSEKISYRIEPGNIRDSLKEANSIGRFEINGLKPDTEYHMTITWGNMKKELKFSTLPQPQGKLLCKYAIIGDPHISSKTENRYGRLHVESLTIMHNFISQLNSKNLDFVLSTGDLTDTGSVEEYSAVRQILSSLNCPFLTVAGNHDFGYGQKSYDTWQKNFGPLTWNKKIKGIPIVGLDTHKGVFNAEDNNQVLESIYDTSFFIILSHYQLFGDKHIIDEDKVVENPEYIKPYWDELKHKKGIIYVGHKNVPSHAYMGNLLQINVPQPVHYPCGILLASVYSNGIYHKFIPIFSEVLNEYSKNEISTRNIPTNKPVYRDFELSRRWNFIYEFEVKSNNLKKTTREYKSCCLESVL